MVTFVFDENWVKFTIRYTVQFDRRRATKHLLSARVLKAIDASGGAVSVAAAAIETLSQNASRHPAVSQRGQTTLAFSRGTSHRQPRNHWIVSSIPRTVQRRTGPESQHGKASLCDHRNRAEEWASVCAALCARRLCSCAAFALNRLFGGLAAELGGKAYACDVTDPKAIKHAFAQVREDLGDVDVLLYNAGSGKFGTFDDVPDDEFEGLADQRSRALAEHPRGRRPDAGEGKRRHHRDRRYGIPAWKTVHGGVCIRQGCPTKPRPVVRAAARARGHSRGPRHRRRRHRDGRSKRRRRHSLRPSDIAETVYHLATQPKSAWSFEVDVRPFKENW